MKSETITGKERRFCREEIELRMACMSSMRSEGEGDEEVKSVDSIVERSCFGDTILGGFEGFGNPRMVKSESGVEMVE